MAISFPAVSIGETLFPESAPLCRLKKVSIARLTGAHGWSVPGRTGREKENAGGLARPGVRASNQLRRYPMDGEDAVE
jgi:hypothetical protein